MSIAMTDSKPDSATSAWQPSAAILKLRKDHDASPHIVGTERAIHYTVFVLL